MINGLNAHSAQVNGLIYLKWCLPFTHYIQYEERMKPCHTAAGAWWGDASPAVRTEDLQHVDACALPSTHSAFWHSLV